MSGPPWGARAALVLGGFMLGCAPTGRAVEGTDPSRGEPVRWILVEKRYGDLLRGGEALDGKVNPEATVLAFQPIYAADLEWQASVDAPDPYFVEVVELRPSRPATPGEVVSATVRVGKAKPDEWYRLAAKPSQPDVRIFGSAEHIVRGAETTVFQFTSAASGRGGIAVAVEKTAGEKGRTK